jgi:asparagine synthase (glutamine-hydrolysing)
VPSEHQGMPGIFGVVDMRSGSGPDVLDTVKQMSTAMVYDAEYAQTFLSWPDLGLGVGWVGFSEGLRSSRGGQHSHGSAIAVTTTGLSCSGPCCFSSDEEMTPAREVVRAYGRSGDLAVNDADVSAGVLVDPVASRVLLFNDPYGRDRIFLHTSGSRVFFASEAKAILAVAPSTRSLDPAGLAELLACGCTLGVRSLFQNIEVLPGGTLLTFEKGAIRRRRHFDLTQLETLDTISPREFLEGFSERLTTAVSRSIRGWTKVGVSLTGGFDSRMIMASLDAAPGDIPCYTFGSMYRTTGDVAVARQVAAACGQPHHVLELGREFLQSAGDHLEEAVYASDGYLGLSGAAELYCNRKARAIAPGRMTGNWGGELMRGVRAFKYALPGGDFVSPELVAHVKESAATFTPPGSSGLSAALFQQVPCQGYGRNAIERSQVRVRTPFLDSGVIRWLYRAPAATRESPATAAAVIARRPDLLSIPTDRGLLGRRRSWWRQASRRALIKSEYLTSHGAPDWLAKLSSALPAHVIETRFLGVDKFHHFRFWIRHDLADLVRDTLATHRDGLAAWFDMPRVQRMVSDHIAGRANHTDAIDKLLTVAVAQKRLLASPTSTRRRPLDRPALVS